MSEQQMSPQRGLQEQLKDAGTKLQEPPTSVDELLKLLDHVEILLSRVEQSPAKSMQDAITPLSHAVVSDVFLRHSNVDVKVAVASCISEITRITAPDAPYDDDKMKDIFQLIVSAFEDLSDQSSRSYNKRVMILETVAKVRSCVVMLDLECDALIVEMFKLFLANIRDYHPENIFSSMETIMALVLDESEDISSEILTPMLACLKKGNQDILPVAVKLSENVFEKCAVKIKPYLSEAIKSLEEYTEVVTAVCGGSLATAENASTNSLVQNNVGEAISMDVDENGPVDADENVSGPPNSAMVNGVTDSVKEITGTGATTAEASVCVREKGQDDEPSAEKLVTKSEDDESEPKLEGTDTIREGEPNSSMKSESSDTSHINGEKEVENQLDSQEIPEKDPLASSREENAVVVSNSPDREAVKNISSPKASDTDAAIVASPTQSDDDEPLKKTGRRKNKERSVQEETPSLDLTSKKASKQTRESDTKPSRSVKKAPLTKKKGKTSTCVDISKNESEGASDSEKKQMKQLGKKMDEGSNTKDEYSAGKSVEREKRRKIKPASEKEVIKTSAKDDLKKTPSTKFSSKLSKDASSPEETPRMIAKRKLAASKQKATEKKPKSGAGLVGTRVKVWWPDDKKFYEGVIDSYDSVKKKHKVLYDDDEEENLNLAKEIWEIIDDDTDETSAGAASGSKKRKKGKMAKPGKPDNSLKSSKKGKGATAKAESESEAEAEAESESESESESDKVVVRSKSQQQRSGDKKKSKDGKESKGKSKAENSPKSSSKVSGSKSKGKTPQKGGDVAKAIGGKVKMSERSPKVQASEGSSTKKRRRT